jgi:hypothetical protein
MTVNIDGSTKGPWDIIAPEDPNEVQSARWQAQVTVAMPLEAIHELFSELIAKNPSKTSILPTFRPDRNIVHVTKDFFQATPLGLSADNVEDDLLGFLSIVLSYAKTATDSLAPDESPKVRTCVMPRTEFTTMFKDVSSQLQNVKLYDLVKWLACYKNPPLGNGPAQ